MAQIERVCPNCGANNPADRTFCHQCGINLISLPASRPTTLPARVDQARAAAVVIGAAALIARAGLQLFSRAVLPRLVDGMASRRASRSASIERAQPEGPPDYIVRGWRAWSFHSGDQHSSGSEQFEWQIRRTGKR